MRDTDDVSGLTDEDKRGLDAIRRQLDADYAVSPPQAAPRRNARPTRIGVGALLLGCALGAAIVALAAIVYLKHADVPTATERKMSAGSAETGTQKRPVPALTPSSPSSSNQTTPTGVLTSETEQSTAHDARQAEPSASHQRTGRGALRGPSHSPAPPKTVEAP